MIPSKALTNGSLGSGGVEKNKEWQRELLMEKLRTHSSQHKTFPELSKLMRMSMLEKRYALDAVEKSNLQKCLDEMQHCILVTSRQGLVERLESLSRQLGLKFMEDSSGLFISSDMFYLEVILDASGHLSDVKVHHECKIEQQSCSELVNCLMRGDFADFTVQLEGLSSVYQLNAEPKVKSKAFVALQAMEMDLNNLFQAQLFSKDLQTVILQSSVGYVITRRGGHAMKLTFFISPYDLVSIDHKLLEPLSIELITSKNIGYTATVNLEASSANKVQTLTTVSFTTNGQGLSVPIYAPLTQTNSTLLPGTFVLRLNKPIPVYDYELESVIFNCTTSDAGGDKPAISMMKLIVETASEQKLSNVSKGLFVSLPDQNQCYFITENEELKGSLVTSISFTEPSQVPQIIELLRKHSMYYTLLSSCVRVHGKFGDFESTSIIEVNTTTVDQISISLIELPFEESMVTIEFDLSNVSNITCKIFSLSDTYDVLGTKLSKILQASLSIPVTIRALTKFWEHDRMKPYQRCEDREHFNLTLEVHDTSIRDGNYNDTNGALTAVEREINGNFENVNGQFFNPAGLKLEEPEIPEEFTDPKIFETLPVSSDSAAILQQFETELKQEDFCESPKSNSIFQFENSNDSSSLGTIAGLNVVSSSSADIIPVTTVGNASAAVTGVVISTSTTDSISLARDDIDLISSDTFQNLWKDNTTNVRNSVSITPISASSPTETQIGRHPAVQQEQRTGIEIIPITLTTTNAPSSITLSANLISIKTEKKLKRSSSDEKDSKNEKKRKRRRDDSPMGPPDKNIPCQNTSTGITESVARKYSSPTSSPKLTTVSSTITSICSSAVPSKPSQKNSPVYNSPKHTPCSSPKSPFGTLSPKHGSSGKPSMSTLKSATTSSPKNDKSSSSSSKLSSSSSSSSSSASVYRDKKDKDSGKERSSSKNPTSPNIKTATIKLKSIDILPTCLESDEAISAFDDASSMQSQSKLYEKGQDCSGSGWNKVRKGSLSAVIDKLKSAQTTGDEVISFGQVSIHPDVGNKSQMTVQPVTTASSVTGGSSSSSSFRSQISTGSEYMIKPSQDGMKITINKTKTKDSSNKSPFSLSSSSKGSSISSPKKHTGLKPGVNSGPASKKSHSSSSSSAANAGNSSKSYQSTKHNFQKSNSFGNLSSSSYSGKSMASSSGHHPLTKSLSTNSFSDSFRKSTGGSSGNKSKTDKSPRSDPTDVMKILQFASPHNAAMEGFMKTFNTKFQIPKLSARNNPTTTTTATTTTSTTSDDAKTRPISAPTTPVSTFSPSPTFSSESSSSSNDSNKKFHSQLTTISAGVTAAIVTASGAVSSPPIAHSVQISSRPSTPITPSTLSMQSAPSIPTVSSLSSISVMSSIPSISSVPAITSIAPIPPVPSSLSLPSTILIPSVSTISSLPSLPSVTSLPSLPLLPSITSLPSSPSIPSLASIPSLPTISSLPPIPSVLSITSIPTTTSIPSITSIPTVPTIPSIASIPSVASVPSISSVPLTSTTSQLVASRTNVLPEVPNIPQSKNDELMRPPTVVPDLVTTNIISSNSNSSSNSISSSSCSSISISNNSINISINSLSTIPSTGVVGQSPINPVEVVQPLTKIENNPSTSPIQNNVNTGNGNIPRKPSPPITSVPSPIVPAYTSSSSSVSVHILKSPATSPLMTLTSSHSNSPCITEDELMDEALLGIGSK